MKIKLKRLWTQANKVEKKKNIGPVINYQSKIIIPACSNKSNNSRLKLIQTAPTKSDLIASALAIMASVKNLRNAVVALLTPLPSILFYLSFLRRHSTDSLSPPWAWCLHHPLLLANILFFLNVDLFFWFLGLLQSSHWVSK